MKRFAFGIVALILTSLIGVTVWKYTLDSTVYSVTFCDLLHGAPRYDQKLVRVLVIYDSGVDTSTLTDSQCDNTKAWIRPNCSTKETCDEMYEIIERTRREAGSPWEGEVRLDVVGRYYASALDPAPNQGLRRVPVLEINEIKDAKFIAEPK